jgi:dolichol-phosphate mannosyltransferase
MIAADLQDPPETLVTMVERWRRGAQVVWAARRERPGDRVHAGFASVYYWIMRRVVGMTEMPARGADFFLIDRVVIDAFRECSERNVSVLALITSLGFRQDHVEYDKQPRIAGASGWTFARKVKLVVDSVAGFSAVPLRLCAYGGIALVVIAMIVGVTGIILLPSLGGGLLLVLATMFGLCGIQLLALSIVGEYVWRTLDEARRRPTYAIEAWAGQRQSSRQGAIK